MERKDIRKERQGLPFFKSELNPMDMQSGIAFGRQYVDSINSKLQTRDSALETPLETRDSRPETHDPRLEIASSRLLTPLVREHMQKDMERLRSTLQLDRIAEPGFQMMPAMDPKMMAMNADLRTGQADLRGLVPKCMAQKPGPEILNLGFETGRIIASRKTAPVSHP